MAILDPRGRPAGMVEIKMLVSADVAQRIATQAGAMRDNVQQLLLVIAALWLRMGATPAENGVAGLGFTKEELLAAAPLASSLHRRGVDGMLQIWDSRGEAPPMPERSPTMVDSAGPLVQDPEGNSGEAKEVSSGVGSAQESGRPDTGEPATAS